jgi:hypothetical protein
MSSSNFVISYMRELDADIQRHRQAIREHQIAIQNLEDTRVLMQQREEFKAYVNGQTSPFGTLPNGATIVTRDPTVAAARALPEAAAVQAISGPTTPAPDTRTRQSEEQKKANKARYQKAYRERLKAQGKPRPDRDPSNWSVSIYDQIEKMMRADPKRVFDLPTINERVKLDGRHHGGIAQALTTLIAKGVVQRLDVGTYQLVQR